MSLEALSTELQQGILGYLDFISLLNIKHTSTIWRDRVNAALSKPNIILSARAKLLELYLELPRRPSYRLPSNIEPFLGEEYLANLRAEIARRPPGAGLGIPAEFELWILEWPHRAPLGFISFAEDYGYGEDGGIGCVDPNKILLHSSAAEDAPVVGIYLSSHGCQDWSVLFFEAGKEIDSVVWKGDICQIGELFNESKEDEDSKDNEKEDNSDEEESHEEESEEEEEEEEEEATSWVDWLREHLQTEKCR